MKCKNCPSEIEETPTGYWHAWINSDTCGKAEPPAPAPPSTPGAGDAIQAAELIPCWHCGEAREPSELELVPSNDTGAKYDYEIKQVLVCKGMEGSLDSPCSEREAASEDRERRQAEDVARLTSDLAEASAARVKAEGELAAANTILNQYRTTVAQVNGELRQVHAQQQGLIIGIRDMKAQLDNAQAALTVALPVLEDNSIPIDEIGGSLPESVVAELKRNRNARDLVAAIVPVVALVNEKRCPACDPSPAVRDCIGHCDKCLTEVQSIDYLHAVNGQSLCDDCARKAGHGVALVEGEAKK